MKDSQSGSRERIPIGQSSVFAPANRLTPDTPDLRQENNWPGLSVSRQIEKLAEYTPDALAIQYRDHCITYRVLNVRANQLAHYLQTRDVGPEKLVGVYMSIEPETVIALLAIIKAGGAYLPIDVGMPAQRIAFLLNDSKVSVILTQERLRGALPEHKATVVCIDRDWSSAATQISQNLDNDPDEEQLAYVIYTSGSTGTPRGVQIVHRGLANLIEWHNCCFDIKPMDRASAITSFSFDASVWGLWPYLAAGASVHIVPDESTRLLPEYLGQWIVTEAVSVAFLPTRLAEQLLAIAWPASTSLRLLLTGGEQLRRYPHSGTLFMLVNNYGPTENTVVATSCIVPSQSMSSRSQLPSIGQPIRHTRIYILARDLQPVPPGSSGEIYIGGSGLARCYQNDSALTAERFLPDPFARQAGARMYQTGDIGTWTAKGEIQFLGRVDNQVKIRGFRVELEEVETALQALPSVRECAVTIYHNDEGKEQLTAYLVPQEGQRLQRDELRAVLKATLPDYMIPTHFVELQHLPLNSSNKIDRQALQTYHGTELTGKRSSIQPRTEQERALANIWKELLSLNQVSIDDNFFELGGHSLSAVQFIFRVRKAFGVDITLRTLFETPTIEQIAQLLDRS